MSKLKTLKAALLLAGLLALPAAHAATMGKADYKAGKTRISADYKADKAACASLAGNTKDICVQEAQAKEKVALAELEYGYTGKTADRNKVLVAKAESAYAVAKERCDDLAGNAKDVCVKEAKAVEIKALADAKMGKEIGEAKKDAAADKLDADYKVAIEKCNALAGDAKSSCVASAKLTYGKT
jgi:cellobiose phosphorylase